MATRRELTAEEQADARRLNEAWLQYKAVNKGANQTWLASAAGLGTQGAVGQYLRGYIPLNLEALLSVCKVLGLDPTSISPRLTADLPGYKNHEARVFSVSEPDGAPYLATGEIEYWDAKGSCGGGFLNYDQMSKGHLIKEASFFKKYDLKPQNAFAVYADGMSMADFIVDGDLVIFDRSKTLPQSGKIFAIDHPDGLRIKMLSREMDGTWVLKSNNVDKSKYPDERITPDHAELLKIHGQFVYRQGG